MARRRRAARMRGAGVLTAVIVLAIGVTVLVKGESGKSNAGTPSGNNLASNAERAPIPAVEAGLLPWSLPAPLSRENVVAGSGPNAVVIGGLEASGASSPRVFSLDTVNGSTSDLGALPAGIHDAAASPLGNAVLQLGGGAPNTVAGVERVTGIPLPAATTSSLNGRRNTAATASTTPAFSVSSIGSLPSPRSDAVAARVGNKVYVIGGYDGKHPDPEVLSTSDGKHFTSVASLKVDVRYPAVATLGSDIFVFGGEVIGGPSTGRLSDAIQEIDTVHRTVLVLGHLPVPLGGASAFVLGGDLYIAGGVEPARTSSSTASSSLTTESSAVYAFDLSTNKVLMAGQLPRGVAYAGSAVVGSHAWIVGGEVGGTPVSSVEMVIPNPKFGVAGQPGAGSPYYGSKLLIADRGNNRLLVVDDTGKIIWTYPSATMPPPPGGFFFPDDAFFANHGTEIISNQEENETIVIIAYPSGKLLWQYGHPKSPGSAPGYLHEPDDAYLLKNGQITVADADNCRVLFINQDKTIAAQIGTNDICVHKLPTTMVSPNGDTPLADGNFLVSEIRGSFIDEFTESGHLLWTVHVPVGYPSDPQQLGPDLYLLSDYSKPGGIVEFNRQGQILYSYYVSSGPGELNQPSLTELLPSGVFMSNDDYRDRLVAIDPATQALVWQYGITDVPGTAPGQLNTPDGFDILMPDGSTPTHPYTG